MNQYYYKIKQKSLIRNKALKIANDNSEWGIYYNFFIKLMPHDLILQDNFLNKLYLKHNFTAYILKTNANTFYNWHIDIDRPCTINMLLNIENKSHCFFSNNIDLPYFNFKELIYEKDTYYAFNVKEKHCVINFDKPRYVLSIGFKPIQLTYNELLNSIKEIDLL